MLKENLPRTLKARQMDRGFLSGSQKFTYFRPTHTLNTPMIQALIVDDETRSCDVLQNLLLHYCPDVNIAGIANSADEGYRLIQDKDPDLVFLDIHMPKGDGFSLLSRLKEITFKIIFTTAYDNYAIQAFRMSALDYLLKPIDSKYLQEAVEKFRKTGVPHSQASQVGLLHEKKLQTLALSSIDEIRFVNLDEIIRLEADNNYTVFYLTSGEKVLVSNTLKIYEDILSPHSFFRVHNSHIINLVKVKKYLKGKGGIAVMSDGSYIEISPRKKDDFLKAYSL
jgi:two-component system LytT family response regulator